jgi:hypothetical protein
MVVQFGIVRERCNDYEKESMFWVIKINVN